MSTAMEPTVALAPDPERPREDVDAPPEGAENDLADEVATRPRRVVGRFVDWCAAQPFEAYVTFLVIATCIGFTLMQLHPDLLVADTTPSGGDMGAHVWGPAYLRDHLLPDLRLSGWSPDWYAGFPAYQFYMVVPSLLIVLLDLVLPYGIAFKLVTVSGVATLPVAAWAFGRLSGLKFPTPTTLAVATVPFLFYRGYTIYGGNIPSTLAGEFAFSIALSLAVLYLGVLSKALEEGKYWGWATGLLALTGLCHIIPVFFAIVGTIVMFVLHAEFARRQRPKSLGALAVAAVGLVVLAGFSPLAGIALIAAGFLGFLYFADPSRFRFGVLLCVTAGLLSAWWWLPFAGRHHYVNDMGWEKITLYYKNLAPTDLRWVMALAIVGAVLSVLFWLRGGLFLLAMCIISALAFRYLPENRLWNARVLPFYYLTLFLLAGLAVAELAKAAATLVAADPAKPVRWIRWGAPVLAFAAVFVVVGLPLRVLPFADTNTESGAYSWMGITTKDRSFVPSWARWNYTGYERKPNYPEYRNIVRTMDEIGQTRGCGRAMWEYEKELDRYGTPMSLMLLPFWTDSCIGSMEGLFFESSPTTPYHFLVQSELSDKPSQAQRFLKSNEDGGRIVNYPGFDMTQGVQHLQMLGVRYYMATSDKAIREASANPDLTEIARSGPWVVYEVADSDLVEGLEYEPAVISPRMPGLDWKYPSALWFLDRSQWEVHLAETGPPEWERVRAGEDPIGRAVETPAVVSDIESGLNSIRFSVDQVGKPVLVKASYFPNWEVKGGKGPWRVSPNLMVVIPTDNKVELTYGRTSMDWLAYVLTAAGVVLLVYVVRRGTPLRRIDRIDRSLDAPLPEREDLALVGAGHPVGGPLYGPPLPPPVDGGSVDHEPSGPDAPPADGVPPNGGTWTAGAPPTDTES